MCCVCSFFQRIAMSLASIFLLALVLFVSQAYRVTRFTRYVTKCRSAAEAAEASSSYGKQQQKTNPLDREMDIVAKGLSHIKYNKFAPTPEEAKNMTTDEFRSTIYKRMKDAELQRRKEQGNKVGGAVSDDYLESLGNKNNIAAALIISFISMSGGIDVANAQTPNMDQYNQGSGTYVGKRVTTQSIPEIVKKVKSYDDLKSSLSTCRKYVGDQNWNDVILVIDQMKAGVNNGILKENLKDDFVFYIDQVNDLAVENRVLFFNKEDLEQVQMIKDAGSAAAERSKIAIEEAVQIINTVEKFIG